MVALELETGERKIEEFDSNQNLWQIIHKLFENHSVLNLAQNMEFCVIYIGKEIEGEIQLKQTNLRSLGITQGKVAMKLLVRTVNSSKEQAFVESLNLKKPINSNTTLETNKRIGSESKKLKDSQSIEPSDKPVIEKTKQLSELPIEKTETKVEKLKQTKISTPKTIINDNPIKVENINQKSDEIQEMEVESEESSDESNEIINYLGNNCNEILFKMSDLPKLSKIDFPDDFYETTKDDLVTVLNDLRRQQVGNKGQNMETKQMREQTMKEKIRKYKTTVIRVCLPNDKLVFQAIFKPSDTIAEVIRVLNKYTEMDDFYLYTVPPKRILKPESTLFDSDLVPAALIHLGSNCANSTQTVIKEEFKEKLSSYKSAAKIAINTRRDTTLTQSNQSVSSVQNIGHNSEPLVLRPQQLSSGEKERKIPKWFNTKK